jgi:arginase
MSDVKKIVEIIGVPADLGGGSIRGTCMGPAAIRMAGLRARLATLGYVVSDRGDVAVPVRENIDPRHEKEKFIIPILELCQNLMSLTQASLDQGRLPVLLGGDHSMAIGSISGVAAHMKAQGKKLGLIWVDAHGDINTPETSPTGHVHGMPLATILGYGHELLVNLGGDKVRVLPQNVALIGIRNIDANEKRLLQKSGIHFFTMRDIDEMGMAKVIDKAFAAACHNTDGIHISYDMDSLDPLLAPGVSVPEQGGLSFREARMLMERAYETGKIISLELVEVNPACDIRAQTAMLAVDLIESALGRKIV